MRSAVALMIFNRPDFTERVFAEIARARPRQLLVIADGPRPGRSDDVEKCAAARAVIERVNWECDVLKDYADINMGCGHRPATGLRWVFEQVEEAIILEDDCIPHPTFFRFCEDLLERYRDDERVMHIAGANFVTGQRQTPYSYSFSRYSLSWGWASWRRAFKHYDPTIKLWPSLRDTSWLLDRLGDDPEEVEHWKKVFDLCHSGIEKVNTWDFQWVFACWAQSGLAILSNTNLVTNVGFREDSTHTRRTTDSRANLPANEISFPLNHPPYIARDGENDQRIVDQILLPSRKLGFGRKLRRKCIAALPAPLRGALSSLFAF